MKNKMQYKKFLAIWLAVVAVMVTLAVIPEPWGIPHNMKFVALLVVFPIVNGLAIADIYTKWVRRDKEQKRQKLLAALGR